MSSNLFGVANSMRCNVLPLIGRDLLAATKQSPFLILLLLLVMNVPSEQYLAMDTTDEQLLYEFLTLTLHSIKK